MPRVELSSRSRRDARSRLYRRANSPGSSYYTAATLQGVLGTDMSKLIDGMHLNHLEITVAKGSLAPMREALLEFYVSGLGFGVSTIPDFGDSHLFLLCD